MSRTRVKICGITNTTDALTAVEEGADAIGLVFYEPSPRAVTIDQAVEIASVIPAFVSTVALFVNASKQLVDQVVSSVRPSLLQFHGDESAAECASYQQDFIKAIRVNSDANLIQYAEDYKSAKGLLLDTYTKGVPGGTGQCFDWALIPDSLPMPIILAGGLDASNVGQAIKQVKPFAVDVSGGVERSKGLKDARKINAFIQQAIQASVG